MGIGAVTAALDVTSLWATHSFSGGQVEPTVLYHMPPLLYHVHASGCLMRSTYVDLVARA